MKLLAKEWPLAAVFEFFRSHSPATFNHFQAPNRMNLRREQLPRGVLHSFNVKHHEREMYRVAARLWAGGHMDWHAAKQLAEDAFKEVPEE